MKKRLFWVLKVVLFACLYTLSKFASLTIPSLSNFPLYLIGGLLLAITLAFIIPHFRYKSSVRFLIMWLVLFIIGFFSNAIEAVFFTALISNFALSTLIGILVSGILAFFAVMLFPPVDKKTSYPAEVKLYFQQRSPASWAWRIIVASLAYLPVYFFFGMIIGPFVLPYYKDPALHLSIPAFTTIIPLEIIRGFLYVLALLPLIAGLKLRPVWLIVTLAVLLYVPGGLVPLITNSVWPIQLRIYHGLEILGDCIVYGVILRYLLSRRLEIRGE